jgi:hypothetical protein
VEAYALDQLAVADQELGNDAFFQHGVVPNPVAQQRQAVVLAFLGMELGGRDIPGPHHGCYRDAVVGRGDQIRWLVTHHVETVDEVEVRLAGLDTVKQRVGRIEGNRVPAHVRHLERSRHLEAADLGVDPAQAAVLAVLDTAAGDQLHAQAHAQHWLVQLAHLALQHRFQVALGDGLHGVAERAHAGQHDAVGIVELAGIGGDDRRPRRCTRRRCAENARSPCRIQRWQSYVFRGFPVLAPRRADWQVELGVIPLRHVRQSACRRR